MYVCVKIQFLPHRERRHILCDYNEAAVRSPMSGGGHGGGGFPPYLSLLLCPQCYTAQSARHVAVFVGHIAYR
jgi:hypothetical protein